MGPGSAAHHFVLRGVRGTGRSLSRGNCSVYVSFTRLWRYHYDMTSPPIRQPVRIIGIDPGLRRTGWGVIETEGNRLVFIGCGSVEPPDDLPLASRLQYRKNLAGASEIVRQVFYVHAAYIVLVVLGFAALSLLFPDELVSGRPLGRFLSTFLAVFWLLRVPIQLFYYPAEIRRQNRLADVIFTVAFAFLALVFGLAATR